MRKTRVFRLRNKLFKVFKWFIHKRTKPRRITYHILNPSNFTAGVAMSKLCNLVRSLKNRAKLVCLSKPNLDYVWVDEDTVDTEPVGVPKGYLAVYVGEKEEDTCRVLVPVIDVNHPLFGDLLTEAEKVYGFDHPGGIQIPCRISDFQYVQKQILARSHDVGAGAIAYRSSS